MCVVAVAVTSARNLLRVGLSHVILSRDAKDGYVVLNNFILVQNVRFNDPPWVRDQSLRFLALSERYNSPLSPCDVWHASRHLHALLAATLISLASSTRGGCGCSSASACERAFALHGQEAKEEGLSKVSDNGTNMKKDWAGFDGGFCAAHTLELSVKEYTGAAGIKATLSRDKWIVGYFHRSTAGIQDLRTIQRQLNLPEKKPIQDVATRWFSSYGMVDWFREQQQAVQMYDVRFGAKATENDAYKDNRLKHEDWAINEQSVAVLAPAAQATKTLEGTKYVTISLVLPYIYRLIEGSADGMLFLPWKPVGQQWLRADQLVPSVRAARKLLYERLRPYVVWVRENHESPQRASCSHVLSDELH